MLRLVAVFFLGLLAIPYIHSQGITDITTEDTTPVTILIEPSTSGIAFSEQTTTAPLTTVTGTGTDTGTGTIATGTGTIATGTGTGTTATDTIITTTTTTTTTITTTTTPPLIASYQCDFTTPCFGTGHLDRTNGTQFKPLSLSSSSDPPSAPTSGVASINKPASNNAFCELPYRRFLNGTDSTNWDMWFCYNNQCPTNSSGETAICASDSYGLISIAPTETSKAVIGLPSPPVLLRDSIGDQCLRFYYYFTVYDGKDWGQQMEVWIHYDNGTTTRVPTRNLTMNDMKNNRWEFAEMTFNVKSADSYMLEFNCVVSAENRPGSHATNRIVYFALDDIAVYDYNCSYVSERIPALIRPIPDPTVIPPPKGDLALILGLSLGIGIPVLLLVLGGLIYHFKKSGPNTKVAASHETGVVNTTTKAIVNIPLAPTTKRSLNSSTRSEED